MRSATDLGWPPAPHRAPLPALHEGPAIRWTEVALGALARRRVALTVAIVGLEELIAPLVQGIDPRLAALVAPAVHDLLRHPCPTAEQVTPAA